MRGLWLRMTISATNPTNSPATIDSLGKPGIPGALALVVIVVIPTGGMVEVIVLNNSWATTFPVAKYAVMNPLASLLLEELTRTISHPSELGSTPLKEYATVSSLLATASA